MATRLRLVLALLAAGMVACSACTTANPNYQRPDAACIAETDAQFCSRFGATCEAVQRNDNCAKPRTVDCGSCSGADACVANVCKAPVCSTFAFPQLTLVSALNNPSAQDAVTGVSADGKTVLWQRRMCSSSTFQLLIGDSNAGAFAILDLSAQPMLAAMAIAAEGTLALTADGRTIIGTSADGTKFLQSTRPAAGSADFGAASDTDFAALSVTAPTRIDFPANSSDGLAFYFRMSSNPDASKNGLYETVRASKTEPFPAATKMPGPVQNYVLITAVSSDRMTLFVQNNAYQMAALTRKSVNNPFENPNFPGTPPVPPGFRSRPINDCQAVITTYTVTGCNGEEIAVYAK